jgi:hypothetical protein
LPFSNPSCCLVRTYEQADCGAGSNEDLFSLIVCVCVCVCVCHRWAVSCTLTASPFLIQFLFQDLPSALYPDS